jgi:3-methyladenine DNA glycosylase AlkC
MPAETAPASAAFKHWFDEALYRRLAKELAALAPKFDRRRFLSMTLDGLDDRELMDRLRQTAVAFDAALPGAYSRKLDVLRALAPRIGHTFVAIALCDFVAQFGLKEFERSLDALRFFTRFGSAEFAVRPFLAQDLDRTLAVMRQWALDSNEHVRRLASEGSRPRLPWGQRLKALMLDPNPVAPILEELKADPSLYVRKSVANHLNDIAKDHPTWVLDRVERWDPTDPRTAWIIRRGLRTLIKAGHPRALALLGVDSAAATHIRVQRFTVTPARVTLGDPLQLELGLTSTAARLERLVIDYVVHYVKADGETSAKVFKWAVTSLAPEQSLELTKRQSIRDFTTRRHYPGRHRVEVQINGHRVAETAFTLRR